MPRGHNAKRSPPLYPPSHETPDSWGQGLVLLVLPLSQSGLEAAVGDRAHASVLPPQGSPTMFTTSPFIDLVGFLSSTRGVPCMTLTRHVNPCLECTIRDISHNYEKPNSQWYYLNINKIRGNLQNLSFYGPLTWIPNLNCVLRFTNQKL